MSSAFKQYCLYNILTNNKATSAELESQLGDSAWLAALSELLQKRHIALEMASNPTALETLLSGPNSLAAVLSSNYMLNNIFKDKVATFSFVTRPAVGTALKTNPSLYTTVNSFVNNSMFKIRRSVITATGTWTYPTEGVYAMSVAIIGGGSSSQGRSDGCDGGGGGQCRIVSFGTSGFPTVNTTATVGAGGSTASNPGYNAGANSSFGAYGTALGASSRTGAGEDENGGADSVADYNFTQAIWQPTSCAIKGGTGGRGANGLDDVAGSGGSPGLGGQGGTAGSGATGGAGAGTAYCNGGGGGGYTLDVNGIPSNAANNTGAGGGAAGRAWSSDPDNGGVWPSAGNGAGGSGLIVVYYIVN